eukprot:5950237-Amphidinium_carterae.1
MISMISGHSFQRWGLRRSCIGCAIVSFASRLSCASHAVGNTTEGQRQQQNARYDSDNNDRQGGAAVITST